MKRIESRALRARCRAIAAGGLLGLAIVAPAEAADLDLTGGVLAFVSNEVLANTLAISLAGGVYTIDDPAEASVVPTPNALGAGCAASDANTVTCPASAVVSLDVSTRFGDDLIVLTNVAHPATLRGGPGFDTILGGGEDDTFVWNPGDGGDALDGGAGHDTLMFNGSNASENITVTADGPDFELFRDVANIQMEVHDTEALVLSTFAGVDHVTTTSLLATTQTITDGDDAQLDVLTFDAAGLCPFIDTDSIDVIGRPLVQFSGFSSVSPTNAVCGAIVDLSAGTLSYFASLTPVSNALTVSLAGPSYTLNDTGEAAVSITRSAFEQGCATVAANTVTCPEAAVTSFVVDTNSGDDSIVLTGAVVPALVRGGFGSDTMIGGSAADRFVWSPGGSSDTVDGGPGSDTLEFNGSSVAEHLTITPDGTGFELFRDIANARLNVQNTEVLELATLGGIDDVSTTNLLGTMQVLTAGPDLVDTLRVDGGGLCVTQQNDTFESAGREPIRFTNFAQVLTANMYCRPDPCETAVATQGCKVNGVRNQPCEGTSGDDVIVGSKGPDVIRGGGGNDRIAGGEGDDLLCGDAGDDVLVGGPGNDTLSGGLGDDRLRGNSGNDVLVGGEDDDELAGSRGLDELDGGPGDDRLRGGGDVDVLRGNLGMDSLDGGGGDDFCNDADEVGPFLRCEMP